MRHSPSAASPCRPTMSPTWQRSVTELHGSGCVRLRLKELGGVCPGFRLAWRQLGQRRVIDTTAAHRRCNGTACRSHGNPKTWSKAGTGFRDAVVRAGCRAFVGSAGKALLPDGDSRHQVQPRLLSKYLCCGLRRHSLQPLFGVVKGVHPFQCGWPGNAAAAGLAPKAFLEQVPQRRVQPVPDGL